MGKAKFFIEELDVKGADYSTLKTFFTDHNPRVDTAIGRIDNTRVENEQLLSEVVFGSDEYSQLVSQKYREEILTDVSIGYFINDFTETSKKGEPNHVLVTDYTIVELSAVWKGADAGAQKIKSNTTNEEKVVPRSIRERKLKLKLREI